MNNRFKFRAVLKTDRFSILVEPFYILEDCYFIDVNKAEVEFEFKYPEECFWDFIDEIKKQDYIQEIASDADLIITRDFTNLVQSTGLHDKNGKLIYEGDIAKFISKNRSRDFNVEIKYLDNIDLIESDWLATGYFCVDPNSNLSRCDILTSETALDYEVIGNIYQNKELLNE